MSTVRSISSVSGTLDSAAHSIQGSSTRSINGHLMETLELTTAYTVATKPTGVGKTYRALIVNTGTTEVKVRIERVGSTTWDYFNVPAGRHFEFGDNVGSALDSAIVSIAVRTMSGTGRAIVHQAWI